MLAIWIIIQFLLLISICPKFTLTNIFMSLLVWLILQVICSVLQLINQIIKDNSDFLENACLVGLVRSMLIQILLFYKLIWHCIYSWVASESGLIYVTLLLLNSPFSLDLPLFLLSTLRVYTNFLLFDCQVNGICVYLNHRKMNSGWCYDSFFTIVLQW